MAEDYTFLLRAHCATYNHVHYIIDALNGFVMQETDFPYVCSIIDDASTDGEQEVIKKYLLEHFDLQDSSVAYDRDTDYGHVTFAQHKTNRNCYFAVVFLRENHYSQRKTKAPYLSEWMNTKYIALCEGDDYWTDPLKLQKQVDFLESYEDFSMCFHRAMVKVEGDAYSERTNGTHYLSIEDREYTSTEFVSSWLVPTASIVYRKRMIDSFSLKHPERMVYGDIKLVLTCAHVGKVMGMSDVMSVYRIQPNSITNDPKSFNSLVFRLPEHYLCLRENFPKVKKGPLEWSISYYYYVRMKRQHKLFPKIRDFVMFVWWDPKQAIRRVGKIINKRDKSNSIS